MTPIQKTLLAIALFLALAVGLFIYFIANWDPSKAQSIGLKPDTAPFSVPEKSRGLGQSPSPAAAPRAYA